jgi:hypothetical protein
MWSSEQLPTPRHMESLRGNGRGDHRSSSVADDEGSLFNTTP